MSLNAALWPQERLSQLVEALAHRVPGRRNSAHCPRLPKAMFSAKPLDLESWLSASGVELGVEIQESPVRFADLEDLIAVAAPVLLAAHGDAGIGWIGIVGHRRHRAVVIGADGAELELDIDELRRWIWAAAFTEVGKRHVPLLQSADIPADRQDRLLEALVARIYQEREHLAAWSLVAAPSPSIVDGLRLARVPSLLAGLVATTAGRQALWLLSWYLLGRSALLGTLEPAGLLAWLLVLLSMVPLQMLETWIQGRISIGAGGLLRQRMLRGLLELDSHEVRQDGVGRHLGRVMEAASIERLAIDGGFTLLIAAVELPMAAWVLLQGAAPIPQFTIFALLLMATSACCLEIHRRRLDWVRRRVQLSDELIELTIGHRTRQAQQPREQWYDGDDAALEGYFAAEQAMERLEPALFVAGRLWTLLALAAVAVAVVVGAAPTTLLAVSVGGIFLGARAFGRFVAGFNIASAALRAWDQVADIYRAAARHRLGGSVEASIELPKGEELIEAEGLGFRHEGRAESVFKGLDLSIRRGDRILLEGPSGGGKSTLAALLAGLRTPDNGLLLLDGLDRHVLGEHGWRKRVALAPQFHENHVFTNTFAFNLLMGRRWPPRPADIGEAEALCHQLGLGPLLDKMPSGMQQMVGESGWRLSHGERSRLFLARALLQGAELVILDESFAALDPSSFEVALAAADARAETLLVIAHP